MKGLMSIYNKWHARRCLVTPKEDLPAEKKPTSTDFFRPALFLLLLSGIDVHRSCRRAVSLSFGVLFHAACLGIIAFKVVCLMSSFRWNVMVTITMKVTALVLWWVVRARREGIARLIDTFVCMVDVGDRRAIYRTCRTASLLSVLFMCVQPALLSVRFLALPQGKHPTCALLQNNSLTAAGVAGVLLHEFSSVYVNCSITYAVAVLYLTCCKAFAASLFRRPEKDLVKLFDKVLTIFKSMEEFLSPCILVVFVHLLSSLFKDMVILILVVENRLLLVVPAYVLDFAANALLSAAGVLCAEDVQHRADDVREALLALPPHQAPFCCCGGRYVKASDDRRRIKLTAWGLFELKKPLLLTIGAWLVTYGVIILQFSKS